MSRCGSRSRSFTFAPALRLGRLPRACLVSPPSAPPEGSAADWATLECLDWNLSSASSPRPAAPASGLSAASRDPRWLSPATPPPWCPSPSAGSPPGPKSSQGCTTRPLWNCGMRWMCIAIWATSGPVPSRSAALGVRRGLGRDLAFIADPPSDGSYGSVCFRIWSISRSRERQYLSLPEAFRNELMVPEPSTARDTRTRCALSVSWRSGAK
mmetsp:Transcript_127554/g.360945  ORF Transcript_127554/g.360945 Transcript_127554/m.360945 type:complete len:212 (+) Transcript_127554:549-1184(+)